MSRFGPKKFKGMTDTEIFWAKVDRTNPQGCWIWTGAPYLGYGRFCINSTHIFAHRYSYGLTNSLIEGLTIDHLCLNKLCVNPNHLEQVTRAENTRRANQSRTACKHGHVFTPENTRYAKRSGRKSATRCCRACDRKRWRDKQIAKREVYV